MNTTARADSPKETDAADLLEELASADAAHAPEIADVIADLLTTSLEASEAVPHRQLAAEFDGASDR